MVRRHLLFVALDCSVETRPATVKGQQRVGRKLRGKKSEAQRL